jgi:cation diffusion facilitator CzcD-associated flavoprotein CzcO
MNFSDKYCIVGAGSSGLTAAKNLKQHGIAFDVIERNDDVGGNWYFASQHSAVCKSTHLISSKPLTEFTDYPMPAAYPEYPNHWQVHTYFQDYARHFGLYEHIQFNTSIEKIERDADGLWDVTLSNGETRRYGGLIIANGHNWSPKWPDYPGQFDGIALHSCQYKTPDVLRDQRVLVIGAGNSGCDIAVESAQNAARTFLSTRRGYYYNPKFIFGKPSDQVNERFLKLRTPLWLMRASYGLMLKLTIGLPQDYGLPKPDHRFFETHPVVNQTLMYYAGQGDIKHKPDVAEFRGKTVVFKDGSEEEIDVLICATGFNIVFPFIDKTHLNWIDNRPQLYLNVFHPSYDNLFVIGLIQPDSGAWGLADYQAQAVARFIDADRKKGKAAQLVRRLRISGTGIKNRGIRYVNSTRHYLEVEHFSYRETLQKLIRRMGPSGA